ncbi:pectinesterase inhibitor 8-like [Phragmites australis]|uniref:pectinesterase inhibitor 8-like n=1 Tax=Phragmites australis TaxID=29695 RepID=UPI002D781E0C|nr:pectinesterase inhibitor 8-like [Phragmites australis]
MRPSTARVLAAAALTAALLALSLSTGVDATPETTCWAAAARDRRVDYGFCVSRLSHLAKVATDVGIAIAGGKVYDIKAMLAKSVLWDPQSGLHGGEGKGHRGRVPGAPPLARWGNESVQIAIVCTAITSLIR